MSQHKKSQSHLRGLAAFVSLFLVLALSTNGAAAVRQTHIGDFTGHSPFHINHHSLNGPVGLSPSDIKSAYNLTNAGSGSGTVVIVDAYNSPNIASDINTFSSQYGLPQCTTASGCLTVHEMVSRLSNSTSWGLETSLDTEWAHAIAPGAKILLVEARSASGTDLLNAVNYARSQPGVVSISMSWGGSEFSTEAQYDSYFTSTTGATFFASAGDSGSGVEWPAVSPNVIGVGGTTLHLTTTNTVSSETAWSGSGGGVSVYETQPSYQTTYGIGYKNRTVPDVSYDADPSSGVSVYDSYSYYGQRGWFEIGGTSVGAPQWAAIRALGSGITNTKLYSDAKLATGAPSFRDITTGINGSCGTVCSAAVGYDTVTGLGSPLSTSF